MKSTRYQAYIIAALLLFTITAPISNATQEAQEITTRISSWLVLGPHPVPLPAFHEEKTRSFTLEDLLKFDEVDISQMKPKAGSSFRWHDGALIQWSEIQAGENGIHLTGDQKKPSAAYLGVYILVTRWTKVKITLKSPQMLRVYLDGKIVSTKATVQNSKEGEEKTEGRQISSDLKMETGKQNGNR